MTDGLSDGFTLPLKWKETRYFAAILDDRHLHVVAHRGDHARELRMEIRTDKNGIGLLYFGPGSDEIRTEFAAGDKPDLHRHSSNRRATQFFLVSPNTRWIRSIASAKDVTKNTSSGRTARLR